MNISGIKDIAQMQSMVLNDDLFVSELLQDLSITVTEMFRDPVFYKSLRESNSHLKNIPIHKKYGMQVGLW
jgi:chemotaxis protein methyltransferase CheR